MGDLKKLMAGAPTSGSQVDTWNDILKQPVRPNSPVRDERD